MSYWWMHFNYVEFKVPRPTGKIVLMIDMLEPCFVLNPEGMTFKFEGGKKDSRKIGDFAPYMGFTFFVSQPAYEVISPFLEQNGRCWPMTVGKYSYYFVLIESVESGFDYERSRYSRFAESGHVRNVTTIILESGFQSSRDIFRLAGDPGIAMNLIVSDRFRELYENNHFTGLFFTAVPT